MDSYAILSMSAKNESAGCCTPSGLNEEQNGMYGMLMLPHCPHEQESKSSYGYGLFITTNLASTFISWSLTFNY
jgi:hypothetical protein